MSDDAFRKVLQMIREDPNLKAFHKEQLIKALTTNPEPGMNEDEFLENFPPEIRIFLVEHFPYPIPKYLRKLSDYK